jgi:kinesin family protein 3/17
MNLSIREDKKRGVYVDGLSEWVVRSPAEIYGLMERGAMVRATGETKMNELSSRSHAVFIIIVEQSKTVYVDDKGNEMSSEELSSLLLSQSQISDRSSERIQQQIILQKSLEEHVRQSFKVA